MSLLHNLPYKEYKNALNLTIQECERVAELAGIKIKFSQGKPGDQLVKALDRIGYSYNRYTTLIGSLQQNQVTFQPQTKVAVLIANERYCHLAHLATPTTDCECLSEILRELGFVVMTLKNSQSSQLSNALRDLFEMIPENSYCFIFYAGHGCQLTNIQCMLGVECPTENIELEHCVTENDMLSMIEKRKPELVVLIMDMCRVHLDRATNAKIYKAMPTIDGYPIHKNLLISYTAQSSQSAYEVLEIECTGSLEIDNNATYELKTEDLNKIVPGASQYTRVLSERLADATDINSILDRVHAELEKCVKKQRPIKVQCGSDKRSLHDKAIGDTDALKVKISEYLQKHKQLSCSFDC